MPGENDLPDFVLEEAVTQYLKAQGAPPNSVYDFVRDDLNGDGAREGIILFKLPHTYWCGWDGCTMAIFKSSGSEFTPLTTTRNVRGPIYVSSQKNRGWKDIIIRVSGANMADKNVILKFNGRSYPKTPLTAPNLKAPLRSLQTDMYFR